MTDRPILFSAPMVKAILREVEKPGSGKTQTRRMLSRARVFATPERPAFTLSGDNMRRALQNAAGFRRLDGDGWFWEADAYEWQAPASRTGWMAHIGYAPGDRLWVRETYSGPHRYKLLAPRDWPVRAPIWHWADGDPQDGDWTKPKPGIHMPRWASRLTLIVESVKVERLHDISDKDARAEGAGLYVPGHGFITPEELRADPGYSNYLSPRLGFEVIWTEINGAASWEANPFVVAITFRPHLCNIDTMPAAEAA